MGINRMQGLLIVVLYTEHGCLYLEDMKMVNWLAMICIQWNSINLKLKVLLKDEPKMSKDLKSIKLRKSNKIF